MAQSTTVEGALQYLADESTGGQKSIQNFINGDFVESNSTEKLESEDPSTGELWLQLPNSNKADVDSAVSSAASAFSAWSSASKEFRAKLLNRVADIVEANSTALAELESRDQGKTVAMARQVEIPRCVHNFRVFASAILCRTETSSFQQEPIGAINVVKSDPMGVAVLISPWNLPLYLLSFKLAPALACGNTVVCKPSEMTSATAWVLMHAFKEAGFPNGVVNMVLGVGQQAGESLVSHPRISLISFTGSTAVGRRIGAIAGRNLKKVSLELGGKNAGIVFPSVNFDEIIEPLLRSCFANQGEICLCTSRLFVHNEIFDQFLEKFITKAKQLKVGDPRQEDTYLGALISNSHKAKVTSYITLAQNEPGTNILCGGSLQLEGKLAKGHYVSPTVITGMSDESPLMQEEIFGPVICVSRFSTLEEVARRANAIPYGLSATVWSKDANELLSTASLLRVGTVWCNCWLVRDLNMPFGGAKESGIGREGVEDSIHFFTDQKTICVKMA